MQTADLPFQAARIIGQFSSLALTTTESLAYVLRLLTEMLPADKAVPSRRGPYLRSRMHGVDVDSFALELARLSLTLTDIPNPNGWDLEPQDMFLGDRLAVRAKKNTILLANPPFDNFTPQAQQRYREQGSGVRFVNKSAEMLWRTLPHLPEGGVFGIVVPQTVLYSDNAHGLREFLSKEYELREICLFPDKVFSFSDAESAVLVGRRKAPGGQNEVRYRRIRERELDHFRSDYTASTTRTVRQTRFSAAPSFSLRLPELEEVWSAFADNPTLAKVASVGQGLIYRGADLPSGSTTHSEEEFAGSHLGFVLFGRGLQLHELPKTHWMNLAPEVIRRAVSGTTVGIPQVLLNYARVSRGPWRLKALIDKQDRARSLGAVSPRRAAARPISLVRPRQLAAFSKHKVVPIAAVNSPLTKGRASACFVAREAAVDRVAGFYTLAAGGILFADMPVRLAKRLPRYPTVPVARPGAPGRGSLLPWPQTRGALLWDAVERAGRSEVAVCALVVDAKDEPAKRFYLHHGFVAFGDNPRALILPLPKRT